MSQPWYSIRAHARAAAESPKSAEVYIFGDIGESWWEETVTAKQFVQDFAAIDADQITIRINSYGGSVTDGIAIYNAIRRHPAQVSVSIEAAAYSIASLIAMAGDTVEMADNALLMIHAPWGGVRGNSKEMRDMADTLDKYAAAQASSYVRKSGMAHDDILALLTDGADHWYSADEALASGFVDAVVEALGEVPLEDLAARRVAARFEGGGDEVAGMARPQRRERLAYGARVVAKVLDDGHAARVRQHFLAAAHALEFGQGGDVERGRVLEPR